MHKKYKPIKFPHDESAHDYITEWWYFNGHLKDKHHNEYAFMNCLFRVEVQKVNMPFLRRIPFKISHFSHSLVTDLKNKKFQQRIAPFSILSEDSFSKPLLYINYINLEIKTGYVNCAIEKTGEKIYHIKNEDMDLQLTAVKKPLLEGGKGFIGLHSKTTYYYSLTNLKTTGRIKIKNKWVDVTGKSWMDHQWADASYTKDKWNWFSIQLDNNTELVCYEYDDGKVKSTFADICYADDRQEHHQNIQIIPSKKDWTSPKSKAVYPLVWKIIIPQKNIELNLTARLKDQEMLFGSINYWEGPIQVEARLNRKIVKGVGFMELVGYPSQYSNIQYLSDELLKTAGQFISLAKNNALNLTHNIKL
jgi:predicted secreted hydrolase